MPGTVCHHCSFITNDKSFARTTLHAFFLQCSMFHVIGPPFYAVSCYSISCYCVMSCSYTLQCRTGDRAAADWFCPDLGWDKIPIHCSRPNYRYKHSFGSPSSSSSSTSVHHQYDDHRHHHCDLNETRCNHLLRFQLQIETFLHGRLIPSCTTGPYSSPSSPSSSQT